MYNYMGQSPGILWDPSIIHRAVHPTAYLMNTKKFLVFLYALLLCTGCVQQGFLALEPSRTLIARQTPFISNPPTSTNFPISTVTPVLLHPSPTPIFDVVIDNVTTGRQGQIYASGFGTSGDDIRHYAQWNNTKWSALGNGFQTAGNTLIADSAGHLYTETLTSSAQGQATAIMRWDGSRWEDITGNFSKVIDALKVERISSNIPVLALAVDGEDNLYAAGVFYYPTADHTGEIPMGYVAKWNQKNWTILGQGFDRLNVFNFVVSATGDGYISGEQSFTPEGNSGYLAKWDGEKWTQLNTGKLFSAQILSVEKSGRLYAYSQANIIAYWNGTHWTTIADQLGGEAPAVYDMAVDENGLLCIGGSFESVNGIPARHIACWNGGAWQALREEANERVNALAFGPGGDLFAVGFFTEAGGLSTYHIARWDGKIWHVLGP